MHGADGYLGSDIKGGKHVGSVARYCELCGGAYM